ncbi:unnamed protein product [Moneuplotes crassus]|uniref:Uncharacterized protein n=1 Tax=Euplotes crassus TaxID=5936 RepID=A0AAD1X6Z1_EUPCR|nr:unnamed protein product [Moneuplotes crassus]
MLEAVDAYGSPITFTNHGRSKFKTACGGVFTILAVFCIIGFIYVMIDEPMKLKKITEVNISSTNTTTGSNCSGLNLNTTVKTIVSSTYNDFVRVQYPASHSLISNGFGISVFPNFEVDPKYGGIGGLYHTKSDGEDLVTNTLDTQICTPGSFYLQDHQRAFHYPISVSTCLALAPFIVQGDFYSNERKIPEFIYYKCTEGDCETKANSEIFHKGKSLLVYVNNGYYDETDSDNPIKEYISLIDVLEIGSAQYHSKTIYIRENEVVFLNGTTKTFYDAIPGLEEKFMSPSLDSPVLSRVNIVMSPEKKKFTQVDMVVVDGSSDTRNLNNEPRSLDDTMSNQTKVTEEEMNKDKYYFILTLLSQIGGFIYLINLIFRSIVGLFIENIKSAFLINTIKTARQGPPAGIPKPEEFNNIASDNQKLKEETKEDKHDQARNTSYQQMKAEIDDKINESKDQILTPNLNLIKPNPLKTRRSRTVTSQSVAKYSFIDIISKSFCCFNYKKPSSPSKLSKFVQAERLLYKEMDVIRILNEIKELRQTNSEMMEAYEMMFQNANNPGLPPQAQQEDSKLSEKLSNHNEEFPEAPVGPASGKENSINYEKDIITKRTPPHNNSVSNDFKSLIHSHHDVSHHREIEQMAVSSIYNIVDHELANLKAKEEDQ